MSRTSRFLKNSATTALLQVVSMAAGLVVPRIMLQYYGSEINGLVSSITQFVAYLSLVEAGLSSAAVYSLYKPLADKDYHGINAIVSAAKQFYTQTGYFFTSFVLGLSVIYPLLVKSGVLAPIYVSLLVLVLGVNGTLNFFTFAKYRVLLTADQKTYVLSLATIVQIILNTAIIVVLSILGANIVLLRTVALLSILTRSLILMVYVKKNYPFLNYHEKPNKQALNKRWDALYLQILNTTQRSIPIFLATFFTSLQLVSVYSIFNMVIGELNSILSIFISGLSASFGDVIARKETETLKRSYSEFEFTYYSIITVIYSVTMVMIMPFIRLYTQGVKDVNYDIPLLGFLFVLNGWLYNVKTPQGMLVISAGLFHETRVQTTVQALIIVVIGVLLAPRFGLAGILTASCLSNLYRDIDLLFFIPRKVTGLTVWSSGFRIIRMLLVMGLVWFPFMFIKIEITTFIIWISVAVGVSIYAVGITLLNGLLFDRSSLSGLTSRLKQMLKGKR